MPDAAIGNRKPDWKNPIPEYDYKTEYSVDDRCKDIDF